MEPSLDNPTGRRKTSSERLQRAIERNRAKQAKRDGDVPQMAMSAAPKTRVVSRKRSIAATPEETAFDRQLRLPRKKMPADVNYSRSEVKKSFSKTTLPKKKLSNIPKKASPLKKAAPVTQESGLKQKMIDLMVYAGWICCLLLMIRLVVADRGVWHYYNRLKNFNSLQTEYTQIQNQNQGLVEEIEMISSSKSYQRKLIRDNLGFISSEEYLLVFSGRRKPTSI